MIFAVIIIVTVLLSLAIVFLTRLIAGNHLVSFQSRLEEYRSEVEDAIKIISSKFNFGHYITESERKDIENSYSCLANRIESLTKSKLFVKCEGTEPFHKIVTALSDTKGYKTINNDKFVEGQLARHRQYFDTILPYPLDKQQREAIVSLEDNVLVISSAGSGKTMTTVGKARYLIDKQNVDPAKILLITFTRKAAASLSERLGDKNLKCVTFHKLALDIIAENKGEKPSIVSPDFSKLVYHELMEHDEQFHHAIGDYILQARYKMRDQFSYSSSEEYVKDRKKNGIQCFFKDMDGRPVFCKSDEESQICDFLGERGIRFRYEEKYEFHAQDQQHSQYKPDFSIYFIDENGHERRVYLEHFAINEQGHVPSWFGDGTEASHQLAEHNYLQGIEWKRILHKEKGTLLIETRSADFHNGEIFSILDRQLKDCGLVKYSYQDNSLSSSRELAKQEESILGMLTAFTFLLKSRGLTVDQIDSLGIEKRDRRSIEQIIMPFIAKYQQMMQNNDEIDFIDAILWATSLCENGNRHDYDYILVDEFQDISIDRYKFLQALRSNSPLTKLFCVGDDWQSIYRFAGSDMGLFKDFRKYFGYTKECRMETTYRFGEPLIHDSSKFILKNIDQKAKAIKPFKADVTTKLEFLGVSNKESTISSVIALIESIPEDKEIYVLGRYSFNVNIFKGSPISISHSADRTFIEYKNRRMAYMTVHQSKGLECDYVILLGCDSGQMGFPSEISDSPLLKYVLSEPDGYEYGEERRVFYVAITRAKEVTFVLYSKEKPSVFVSEFTGGEATNTQEEDKIPEEELCPICRCGRVTEVFRGKAVNGNPFTIYTCSNSQYGCSYKDTVFVNLNSRFRKKRVIVS